MKAITLATALLMVASMAVGAETENKATQTTDTTNNPITGSKTVTKKMKKKVKAGKSEENVEVVEKTKTAKDGTVSTTTEVDADKVKTK